jgi:hypothetical protein
MAVGAFELASSVAAEVRQMACAVTPERAVQADRVLALTQMWAPVLGEVNKPG